MLNLTLTEKGGETKQLSFEGNEITIGRVQGNDIVLPKGNVSKRHCRIFIENDLHQVEDMKSTNGTYVNGRKISETTILGAADKVYVGDFIVKIEDADTGSIASPPQPPPGPPAPPEAGSLSTAIPRRAPPPPPRPSASMRSISNDDLEPVPTAASKPKLGGGRPPLPPPPAPPPPPRRDTVRPFSAIDDDDAPPMPSGPAEMDLLDEEIPARAPKLAMPPLKRPMPPLADVDVDALDDIERDAPTATKNRSTVAVPSTAPPIPGTADGLATWLFDRVRESGVKSLRISGAGVDLERGGLRETIDGLALSAPITEALRALGGRGHPRPAADATTMNVSIAGGLHLAAVLPPAGPGSGLLTRTAPGSRTLSDLVADGGLSKEMRDLIDACVGARRNILLVGDAVARAIVLGALGAALPTQSNVVALVPGLSPPEDQAWTVLTPDAPDAVSTAAAVRPDYLLVDVTSLAVAADALAQGALGSQGLIASVAARSANDALHRIASLAGAPATRDLAAAAFDLILTAARLPDGTTRVTELGEPRTEGANAPGVDIIYSFRAEPAAITGGKIGGRFQGSLGATSRLGALLTTRGASPGRR